jgi:hypothetical protein
MLAGGMRAAHLLILPALAAAVGTRPGVSRAAGEAEGAGLADGRPVLACAPVGKRRQPLHLEASARVANGIVYAERVTADQTRLELLWRPLSAARWTGRGLVPTDLERCEPLLLDRTEAVAACHQPDEPGPGTSGMPAASASSGRRLVRLRPGGEPVRLATALALPGLTHLHPLGGGRLLVWAEAAPRGPADVGGDELTAAELDAGGRLVGQAIVSQPYVRRWPAGGGFSLLRQAPVGSRGPPTPWRAGWDGGSHKLVFAPEEPRPAPGVCAGTVAEAGEPDVRPDAGPGVDPDVDPNVSPEAGPNVSPEAGPDGGPAADQTVALRVSVRGQPGWTAAGRVRPDGAAGGGCLAGVSGRLLPGGGAIELRARGGKLEGRLWTVDSARRPHPRGGTRLVPKVTPVDVRCQLGPAPGPAAR